MDKRFWISGIAAFFVAFTGSWLVHGIWLTSDYLRTPQLFRSDAEAGAHVPFMVAAFLLLGFSFSWIYRQGISAEKPWLIQGIRFGVAVALIAQVPMYLIYYVVQPIEGMTTAKQIIGDTVTMIVCGIVVAAINKAATRVTV
jgi:hypothetical protein